MAKPEDAFQILYGRQATDADRLRLMRIKDALGLRDDDDLWAVFIALGHHQALYEDIPRQIAEKATEVCDTISSAAEKATIDRLSRAVVSQVNKIAGKRAARDAAIWITVAVAVSVTACVAVGAAATWLYRDRVAAMRAEIATEAELQIGARVGQDETLLRAIRAAAHITGPFSQDDAGRLIVAAGMSPARFDWIRNNLDVIEWTRETGIDELTSTQRQRIAAIIAEAPRWDEIARGNHASWPCANEYRSRDKLRIAGVVATMCEVGIGNIR